VTFVWTQHVPRTGLTMTDTRRLPGSGSPHPWDWQRRGACRGVDTSLLFQSGGALGLARVGREAQAGSLCAGCPVGEHARAMPAPDVVRGGLSDAERAHLQRLTHRQLVQR